jgi:glycosyltransferase involved in cell wall biosynthesis
MRGSMRRICVIRQLYYTFDPRVRREVKALSDAGYEVDVICMRRPGEPRVERSGAIKVHRISISHRRRGLLRYLFEYMAFPLLAGAVVTALSLRRRFDLIQVNTIPDSLVFAALVPKLLGTPVLLDLHECMPEFFASKFNTGMRHPGVRLMALVEQASIRFADFALTCTEEMRAAFVGRGVAPEKIAVVMNGADETVFDPSRHPYRARDNGHFQLVCHGSVEERYGIDTAIRAVHRLRDRMPGLQLKIYGEGAFRGELLRMTAELGLERHVSFSDGLVPMAELLDGIASADAGIVAMKRDVFRDLTQCNKMYDLIAMRRPVLCSRTASVMACFPEDSLAYFDSDDDVGLSEAIERLYEDPERAEQLVERASVVSRPYRWPAQRTRYLQVAAALTSRPVDHEALRRCAQPIQASAGG